MIAGNATSYECRLVLAPPRTKLAVLATAPVR